MNNNEACRICGNKSNNEIYSVTERQLNRGEKFHYMYCSKCGTLQLVDDINPSSYYTDSYYSFHLQAPNASCIKKLLTRIIVKDIFIPEWMMYILRRVLGFSTMILYATKINSKSKIVDVGGGNGAYAEELRHLGFKNVVCVDKFCEDSPYSKVDFINGELSDIKGVAMYDLIMFNHSFEHINNPLETLLDVKRLIKNEGICLIRIPICENWVWNKYKEYWRNIDAPRHYFLYTPRALKYLCEKSGLRIKKIRWDSYAGQMMVAENYIREDNGVPIKEVLNSTIIDKIKFWHMTNKINKKCIGDQACFYIVKNR